MAPIVVKIKKINPSSDLALPKFMTAGSSGCDLMADIEDPIQLEPGERKLVSTGLALSIPKGYEAQIRPRSGLAFKKGVTVANAPGTIDADYRGEVKVILINLGQEAFKISRGDRIAQMVFQKIYQAEFQQVTSLDETLRGAGGFGHTGVTSGERL